MRKKTQKKIEKNWKKVLTFREGCGIIVKRSRETEKRKRSEEAGRPGAKRVWEVSRRERKAEKRAKIEW